MITGINNEDRLVQQTFADHFRDCLKWDSVYVYNDETFGPAGTLGRASEREIILTRALRVAIQKLNPELPPVAVDDAIQTLTGIAGPPLQQTGRCDRPVRRSPSYPDR